MLAEIENSYEENLPREDSKKNMTINSHKLRVLYSLTCMSLKDLNNVLLDLLQGCSEANMNLIPCKELNYLTVYEQDNVDHQKLIESVYEVFCQINDCINDGDIILTKLLQEMSSLEILILNKDNEEEYRPYEEIEFERVLEIASIAMERGPYEPQNFEQFSDEDLEKEWLESAECLYLIENKRLYNESLEFEKGKTPLEEYSQWSRPVHEILTNKEEVKESEIEWTHAGEGPNEKSIWKKLKRKCKGRKEEELRDLEATIIDDVYDDILLQVDPLMDELAVHEDDVRFQEDKIKKNNSVPSKGKSKWFSYMDIREDNSAVGYYGSVKFLGIFSLKKGIFVKRREDIRMIENKLNPLLREFSKINWVTRDGTRVAYY